MFFLPQAHLPTPTFDSICATRIEPSKSVRFSSDSDPLSPPRANEGYITSLKERMGHTSVQGKEFKNSPHVSHMYKYREEYLSTLNSFLNQIDYFNKTSQDGEHKKQVII